VTSTKEYSQVFSPLAESGDKASIYEQPSVQAALGQTFRPGGLELTERALGFYALPAGARLLDVGCGTGETARYLHDRGYWASGVDRSASLLGIGRRRHPSLPFIRADGCCLPLPSGAFEAVFAECSLSTFDPVDFALAECERVLVSGNHLILSDLYARNPVGLAALRALSLTGCLGNLLLQADLVGQLASSGFDIIIWEDHSEALCDLACRLAAVPEELARLQGGPATVPVEAWDLQLAIAKARPGYFLLIAQKRGSSFR